MKRLDIRDTVAIRMIKEYFGSDVADIAYERTKQSIKNGMYTENGEDITRVDGLFTWFQTPEGHSFWEHIHHAIEARPKFEKVEPEIIRESYEAPKKIYASDTLMTIQKLYGVEVADLALRRAEEHLVKYGSTTSALDWVSNSSLMGMFCWAETLEGRGYWGKISEKVREEISDSLL